MSDYENEEFEDETQDQKSKTKNVLHQTSPALILFFPEWWASPSSET